MSDPFFSTTPAAVCKFQAINPHLLNWKATGSRVICDPAPLDTDEDFVVLVDADVFDILIEDGWAVTDEDEEYGDVANVEQPFITARKGEVNLIIYRHEMAESFYAFVAATDVAQSLNLLRKEDRVALFKAVLGGRGDA